MENDSNNERRVIEDYLGLYCLEECLDEALNAVVVERPKNPYLAIASFMQTKSTPEILNISLTSVLVNGLRCGVQAVMLTNVDSFSATTLYAGPSVGYRDHSLLEEKVNSLLLGMDPTDLSRVDEQLAKIADVDAAESLAVSVACCRAAARHCNVQPYHIIARCLTGDLRSADMRIPVPVVSVASRLLSPGQRLHSQDITLCPTAAASLGQALQTVVDAAASLSQLDTFRGSSGSSHCGCVCVESSSLPATLKVQQPPRLSNVTDTTLTVGVDVAGREGVAE